MNKRFLSIVAVALVAAASSTAVFYKLISSSIGANGAGGGPMLKIAAAARDLPRGAEITPSDVKLVDWPAGALPAGAIEDRAALEGRVIRHAVGAGEPLLDSRLASGAGGNATAIPAGMRAVSVHVGEYAGVTELVEAGDHVDVLVADGPPGPGNREIRVQTLLEDVVVLATGREVSERGPVSRIPVVTLLVEAHHVNRLSLADHTGVVRLALRNPLDGGGPKISGVSVDSAGQSSEGGKEAPSRLSALRK